MINEDGDHPRGYEYPRPSIDGGGIGPKTSGHVKQLTQANLDKIRKAVISVNESSASPGILSAATPHSRRLPVDLHPPDHAVLIGLPRNFLA